MSFLLDTNVVSEARKPRGNANVKAWIAIVSRENLYISALVAGEIRIGVERLKRRDPRQAAIFEEWLAVVRNEYAERCLPLTPDIAEEWGRMNVPDPLPLVDGLMAATAIVHDLTFVTRNIADFARTGVRLINPFESIH